MAKKRKTTPKEFEELLKAKDIDGLKEILNKCEVNATIGRTKEPVLSAWKIPEELVRWIVLQGADINKPDAVYNKTPLHSHASNRNSNIEIFIELGSDIKAVDKYGNTPLHNAVGVAYDPKNVEIILKNGADIFVKNNYGETPLEYALKRAGNLEIKNLVLVSEILLKAGTPITEKMLDSVTRIGKDFEFYRDVFNKESLPSTDLALSRLYELFNVRPVEKRTIHDGSSPIVVKSIQIEEQYGELWQLLIPPMGSAKTIQGEVIRITGRVRDELYRNGGVNWDDNYKKMLDSLLEHFKSKNQLSEGLVIETEKIISNIKSNARKGNIDVEPNRLCELAVQWVLMNTTPDILPKPSYDR